jgi:hypothetical protein
MESSEGSGAYGERPTGCIDLIAAARLMKEPENPPPDSAPVAGRS